MNNWKLLIAGWLMVTLLFTGCDNKEDDIQITPKYLVDYELFTPALAFNPESAKATLTQFGLTDIANQLEYDIQIYRIVYKTLFEGDSILVSGVVSIPVPLTKNETFPLLSYQHGTIVKKSEAPSVNTNSEFMTYLASTGMVVAIPDYIGFGSSASVFHPFMHKESAANAVLDMIRASKELIAVVNPFKLDDQLFLYGYSQGGSATLAALSAIENNNANSDLTVTAAACGAGAYNLAEMRKWIVKQPRYEQPYFIAYLLESYSRYESIDLDYSLVFSSEFANQIPGLFNGASSADDINGSFGTYHVGELLNDQFENDETFASDPAYAKLNAAFEANKIEAWTLQTSLAIQYGSEDNWIPGDQSLKLFQQFQNNGSMSKVKLDRFNGQNHLSAFVPSLSSAFTWFQGFE
ncbi:MAG: prolyl oligopeptidase family serine peptidase [Prolixibacteraceae bacterium]|nr:prolyl oligopeptidase family serine peptidase [Prolixibacteraceae bacterium]